MPLAPKCVIFYAAFVLRTQTQTQDTQLLAQATLGILSLLGQLPEGSLTEAEAEDADWLQPETETETETEEVEPIIVL